MADKSGLDEVARLIADARKAAHKLGVSPSEIAGVMMDEATLGLIAAEASLSDVQETFQRYSLDRLPKFYPGARRVVDRARGTTEH
jgi:hypothetical protein